jgi:homopolymeric O-antigen transport system permease protein
MNSKEAPAPPRAEIPEGQRRTPRQAQGSPGHVTREGSSTDVVLVIGAVPPAVLHAADLLRELVGRDIKVRYKRSLLGMVWTLLNPLAQLLVFAFVFRVVLPLNIPNYASFLFIGIIVWGWFQNSLYQASSSVVDNSTLIKQPGFPAAILPVVTVVTQLIHFLLATLVLLPFVAVAGVPPSVALLWLPVLVAVQFLVTLGVSYVMAALHVTFRDTQYTLGVLLMLGFYLTPIVYDSSMIPPHYRSYFALNPLLHLVDSYRAILLRGETPRLGPLALLAPASAVLAWGGYRIFKRASHRFIEEL